MIDCLLIHMDDLEIAVQVRGFMIRRHLAGTLMVLQEAVCEGLKSIIVFEPSYAKKRLEAARQEHRSPVFCDRLLPLVDQ